MVMGSVLDLAGFEERTYIRTQHRQFDWATGWNNILQVGMHQQGPDVSEVGSTWLDNLKNLRSLHWLSQAELNDLGGMEAFQPSGWPPDSALPLRNGRVEPPGVYSIPWLLDTRLIYFRRDLLAKAGICEGEAFKTPEAAYETLRRLQAIGIPYPLSLATGGLVIHNMASWVWGRGGSFRSADYRKISLVEPESRRGMVDFFRMHSFVDPATQGFSYYQANEGFLRGKTAVMISGQWAMPRIKEHLEGVSSEVTENAGYAPTPGVPYVGSTNLVIWQHSLHNHDALRLIAHLTSPDILVSLFKHTANFPARRSALDSPVFTGDSDYQRVIESIRHGRGFRSARLWAGIEARLNVLCDQLWRDLFANPQINLEVEIERRLQELAPRLEQTLLANW
jgi:multiple sugar transport system substrate-binding protein